MKCVWIIVGCVLLLFACVWIQASLNSGLIRVLGKSQLWSRDYAIVQEGDAFFAAQFGGVSGLENRVVCGHYRFSIQCCPGWLPSYLSTHPVSYTLVSSGSMYLGRNNWHSATMDGYWDKVAATQVRQDMEEERSLYPWLPEKVQAQATTFHFLWSGALFAASRIFTYILSVTLFCIAMYLIVRNRANRNNPSTCHNCGYDMSGIAALKCPECGQFRPDVLRGPRDPSDGKRWQR